MDYQAGEILYIDKPYRWTSFDVVNKVRWQLCRQLGVKKLKVGHAGTLDPLATGVMIVCTGRATKRIDELQAATKEYVATLRLGATTPSFDMEHPIDATYSTDHITRELVESVLPQFLGRIEQVPPTYSAVKVDGKRAYDLARKDKDVELKPKVLVIDEIELVGYYEGAQQPNPSMERRDKTDSNQAVSNTIPRGEVGGGPLGEGSLPRTGLRNKAFLTSPTAEDLGEEFPSVILRIVCSKGTDRRALARDIGQALGTGAYLTALRRTRIGDVRVEDCMTVEETLEKIKDSSLL